MGRCTIFLSHRSRLCNRWVCFLWVYKIHHRAYNEFSVRYRDERILALESISSERSRYLDIHERMIVYILIHPAHVLGFKERDTPTLNRFASKIERNQGGKL